MKNNLEIKELLLQTELSPPEQTNLVNLFEFTQYLFDNDENLTKTLNLVKKAKDQLNERIRESFEGILDQSGENKSSPSLELTEDSE